MPMRPKTPGSKPLKRSETRRFNTTKEKPDIGPAFL
jgi:hypothetical protein